MKQWLLVFWGVLLLLMGLALLGWVAYNLFVEMQPSARGRSPVVAVSFGMGLVGTGIWRMRTARRP